MEVAGGVVGIASLAIQLADSIRKLRDFWSSVKDAPSDVQANITCLGLFCDVLEVIASDPSGIENDVLLEKTLSLCREYVGQLDTILQETRRGFASGKRSVRTWAAIRVVLNGDKIKKFHSILNMLKETLMLVQQNQACRSVRLLSQRQNLQFQQQSLHQQLFFRNMTNMMSGLSLGGALDGKSHQASICRSEFSASEFDINGGIEVSKNVAFEKISAATAAGADRARPHSGRLGTESDKQQSISRPVAMTTEQSSPFGGRLWRKTTMFQNAWILSTIFGVISVRWAEKLLHYDRGEEMAEWTGEDQTESQTWIMIRPAAWCRIFGIKHDLHLSLQSSAIFGWKHSLQSFRLVNDDAPILHLCMKGDMFGVRQLLCKGEASVYDIDSRGMTALHVAALYNHVELCAALIQAGAERWPSADSEPTPLALSAAYQIDFSAIRLLADGLDFSDFTHQGMPVMHYLARSCAKHKESSNAFEWMVKHFCYDIRLNMEPVHCHAIYAICCALAGDQSAATLDLWLRCVYSTEAVSKVWHGSNFALYRQIALPHDTVSKLIRAGVSYNAEGPDRTFPTFSAMLSSHSSSLWRSSLAMAEIDINIVLDTDLDLGPLRKWGWTREMLQVLLHWHYKIHPMKKSSPCSDCNRTITHLACQPRWICALLQIKIGIRPEDTVRESNPPINSPAELDDPCKETVDQDEGPESWPLPNAKEEPRPDAEMDDDVWLTSPPGLFQAFCSYEDRDYICVKCHAYLVDNHQRRTRPRPRDATYSSDIEQDSSSEDEDEFTPFHIHT